MSRWLPRNHDGPRTFEEALGDLLAIARPGCVTNQAHVWVLGLDPGPVSPRPDHSGALAVHPEEPACAAFDVDGRPVFRVEASNFVGADLHTFDGADYYTLEIRLRDRRVLLRDAYNGL